MGPVFQLSIKGFMSGSNGGGRTEKNVQASIQNAHTNNTAPVFTKK